MSVITVDVGRKRVALTAYCPDDIIGLAACEYVLERVRAIFAEAVPEEVLRNWLIDRDAEWAKVFQKLDAGWRLPKLCATGAINPANAPAEVAIVQHLRREMMQRRSCGANR